MENQKLVVSISNRIPFTLVYDSETDVYVTKTGSGGVAAALSGLENILFCGPVVANEEHKKNYSKINSAYNKLGCIAVPIEEHMYEDYYNEFSNSVLWPLFHHQSVPFIAPDKAHKLYKAYESVNEKIAEYLSDYFTKEESKVIEPVFWVHDYHFFLLPFFLKQKFPDTKVGFFLHIPFPVYEVFRTFYKGNEILENLMYADFIGFHTRDYGYHFMNNVQRSSMIDTSLCKYKENLETKVMVCPVGIDSNKFKVKLNTIDTEETMKEKPFRFLGVDRRDTIKGIPQKLLMFRKFLEDNPSLRRKTELYQILVPSRVKVSEVVKLFRRIVGLVNEINREYGDEQYIPIRLVNGSVSFEVLVGLYRNTDAMLITSVSDGLNLVSFEYLSSQVIETPGVLLLSKFTGAYTMLKDGVLEIDPFDTEFSALQLKKAVLMDKTERDELFHKVKLFGEGNRSKEWAERCIANLISGN